MLCKISPHSNGLFRILGLLLLLAFSPSYSRGQIPGLIWQINPRAAVFAVDAQTNVYANAGGTVLVLSSAGGLLQAIPACPLPGIARRDALGNFYFTGSFDGPQDFGGITLVGGFIDPLSQIWIPGAPTCYLAKYSSSGTLLWAISYGQQELVNAPTDLVLDQDLRLYSGYIRGMAGAVTCFSDSGLQIWDRNVFVSDGVASYFSVKIGGLTSSNFCALGHRSYPDHLTMNRPVDMNGSSPTFSAIGWSSVAVTNGQPIIDNAGNVFLVGRYLWTGDYVLRKCGTQGNEVEIWRRSITPQAQWTLASDVHGNIYLAGTNGMLAQFTTDGELIWSNNFSTPCIALTCDSSGNRFVSFADGSIARLQSDPAPQSPRIISGPQPATVFVGDSLLLSVTASGTPPLSYQWQRYGTNLPNSTASALSLSSLAAAQSGPYCVLVSNSAGSVTSTPALLRVKSVALYTGNLLLTNGTYVFTNPPALTIRSAFANGSAFYTLDGSAPSFSSISYTGPFTVYSSTTVRALGYSADFLQAEEADSVNVVVLPRHTLMASCSGGGYLRLDSVSNAPPAGLMALWSGEGNTLDSVGTNHGTAEGGLTYGPGKVGQGFVFNGIDSGVSVVSNPGLDLSSSNGLTMAAWFNPLSAANAYSLIEWYDRSFSRCYYAGPALWISVPPSTGADPEYTVGTGPGSLYGRFTELGYSCALHELTSTGGLFGANEFHHTALSYDKTSGVAALYLDGHMVAQTNFGTFTPQTSDSSFKLIFGGNELSIPVNHPIRPYAGTLDEIRLYGRALSAAEIQSLYQADVPATNSPSGSYLSTNVLSITAVPLPGWRFMYWLGDVAGTNPTVSISMERDKAVYGVFGTTLSTTVAGNGEIQMDPPGGAYPYGTVVRLTAIPEPGNYFGFWGNAASGNINPLYFTVTNPTPTVSSIFGPTPAGQAALTVIVRGAGKVNVSPRANAYPVGQSVTLTATPDPHHNFLGWSGDADGDQNPISITMNLDKVITANFSTLVEPVLSASRAGLEGMMPTGFRMTLKSDFPATWQIFGSTNLWWWEVLGNVTNELGEVQFTDPGALERSLRFYRAASPP